MRRVGLIAAAVSLLLSGLGVSATAQDETEPGGDASEGPFASAAQALGLAEFGPLPEGLNEPENAGSLQPGSGDAMADSSPDDCAEVRSRLGTPAADGAERVACISTAPYTGEDTDSVSAGGDQGAGVTATPVVWCSEEEHGIIWRARRGYCIDQIVEYRVYNTQTNEETGRATFRVQQEMNMRNTTSSPAKVEEYVAVTLINNWGEASGLQLDWDGACAACNPQHVAPWPGWISITKGETHQKRFDRNIPLSAGQQKTVTWEFEMKVRSVSAPNTVTYPWPKISTRCDKKLTSFGCANPEIRPVVTFDYATRQAGAMLVAIGYQVNNHHWGSREHEYPLTRLASKTAADNNRDIICPDSFVPDANVPNPSCDEYPFARTHESRGNGTVTNGNQCQQLTARQYPNGDWDLFYSGAWDGDAHCLRATTPLRQNSDVGGDLGRATTANRLLGQDPYYVLVYDSRAQTASTP